MRKTVAIKIKRQGECVCIWVSCCTKHAWCKRYGTNKTNKLIRMVLQPGWNNFNVGVDRKKNFHSSFWLLFNEYHTSVPRDLTRVPRGQTLMTQDLETMQDAEIKRNRFRKTSRSKIEYFCKTPRTKMYYFFKSPKSTPKLSEVQGGNTGLYPLMHATIVLNIWYSSQDHSRRTWGVDENIAYINVFCVWIVDCPVWRLKTECMYPVCGLKAECLLYVGWRLSLSCM